MPPTARPTDRQPAWLGFVRRSLGRHLIGISGAEWDKPADRRTVADRTGRPAHSNVQLLASTSGNNTPPSTFIVGVNIRPGGRRRTTLAGRPTGAAVARCRCRSCRRGNPPATRPLGRSGSRSVRYISMLSFVRSSVRPSGQR